MKLVYFVFTSQSGRGREGKDGKRQHSTLCLSDVSKQVTLINFESECVVLCLPTLCECLVLEEPTYLFNTSGMGSLKLKLPKSCCSLGVCVHLSPFVYLFPLFPSIVSIAERGLHSIARCLQWAPTSLCLSLSCSSLQTSNPMTNVFFSCSKSDW